MYTSTLYDADFPAQHKLQDVDVVTLYHEKRFDELDAVIICKDRDGNITATFGGNVWNCLPFSRKKTKNSIKFEEFNSKKELQLEIKLIAFGWLFNKSPKKRSALTFSTVNNQIVSIKTVYRFLANNDHHSLAALSKLDVWTDFEYYLAANKYSQSTLENIFAAINAAIDFTSWHKLDFGLEPIKSKELSKRLGIYEKQQTLVIPERLCNAIYGKAIELVEGAYPHRQLIADIEKNLQDNYLAGENALNEKVKNGATYTFMNVTGSASANKYSAAIKGNFPQKPSHIVSPLVNKIPNFTIENGHDFDRYLGLLITASYIICGGFSGMRDSELNMLTPESYYKETFDGRDYHMLQSHTFKLGEKRATWVTVASSKLAIELMATLTLHWRKAVSYPDKKYTNSLWVNKVCRSKPPTLIIHWNYRLKQFCKIFDFTVNESDYQECLESNPRSLMLIKANVKVGQSWPLAPHQFRRTLAFYCIQNRLGTLVALKQQFKHLYLAMTEWYGNSDNKCDTHG